MMVVEMPSNKSVQNRRRSIMPILYGHICIHLLRFVLLFVTCLYAQVGMWEGIMKQSLPNCLEAKQRAMQSSYLLRSELQSLHHVTTYPQFFFLNHSTSFHKNLVGVRQRRKD